MNIADRGEGFEPGIHDSDTTFLFNYYLVQEPCNAFQLGLINRDHGLNGACSFVVMFVTGLVFCLSFGIFVASCSKITFSQSDKNFRLWRRR